MKSEPLSDSVNFVCLHAPVRGVRNQALILRINDQVEFFERNLPEKIRSILGQLDGAAKACTPDHLQPHRSELAHRPRPVRRGDGHRVQQGQTQVVDHTALEAKQGGAAIHQRFAFKRAQWHPARTGNAPGMIFIVGNLDGYGDAAHETT